MALEPHPSLAELFRFALGFPEAWQDEPWGDLVVKVRKKIFVFLSSSDSDDPHITVKLPETRDHALAYPDAHPTGHGLGPHGWVSIAVLRIPDEERDVLEDFVEESYRAVALKTLVKRLDADRASADS
jgi:predicted DNA-binding protein (MmcQ/YjbR family)